MSTAEKPFPEPTPVTRPFWDSLREQEIGMRVAPVFCDYPDRGITLLRYRPA